MSDWKAEFDKVNKKLQEVSAEKDDLTLRMETMEGAFDYLERRCFEEDIKIADIKWLIQKAKIGELSISTNKGDK